MSSTLFRRVAAVVLPSIVALNLVGVTAAHAADPTALTSVSPTTGYTNAASFKLDMSGGTGAVFDASEQPFLVPAADTPGQGAIAALPIDDNCDPIFGDTCQYVEPSTSSPGAYSAYFDLRGSAPTKYKVQVGSKSCCLVTLVRPAKPTLTGLVSAGAPGALRAQGANLLRGDMLQLVSSTNPALKVNLAATGADSTGLNTYYNGFGAVADETSRLLSAGTWNALITGPYDGSDSTTLSSALVQPSPGPTAPSLTGIGLRAQNAPYVVQITGGRGTPAARFNSGRNYVDSCYSSCASGHGAGSTGAITIGTLAAGADGSYTIPLTVGSNVTSPFAPMEPISLVQPDGGFVRFNQLAVNPRPSITSVAPEKLGQGAKKASVTINGTGFQKGANAASSTTFTFSGPGITVEDVNVASSTSATAKLTIANNATVDDLRFVTAINPDFGQASSSAAPLPALPGTCSPVNGCLTVVTGPTITAVSPSRVLRGSPQQTVTIVGTHFSTQGVQVEFLTDEGVADPGVVAGTPVVAGTVSNGYGTQVTLPVTFGSSMSPLPLDVVVTNVDDRGRFAVADAIGVNTLTVSPTDQPNTDTRVLTFTSSEGHFTDATSVTLTRVGADGVQAPLSGTTSRIDATHVSRSFDFNGVAPGFYSATVTTPVTGQAPEVKSCVSCFRVLQPSAPSVASIAPSHVAQGAQGFQVVVTGTGLSNGSALSFSGTGLSVVSQVINAEHTQITAVVNADGAAATGARNVVVTTADSQVGTLAGGLTVDAAPTLTTVAPATRGQGAPAATLTLTGTNFASDSTVAISPADGLTVGTPTVNADKTSITVSVAVGPTATTGSRSVVVSNPSNGGTVTKSGGFTVAAAPTLTSITPSVLAPAQSSTVALLGSGFVAGMTLGEIPGVTVTGLTITDATHASATFAVAAGAAKAVRPLTLTNTDAGTSTCAACFYVATAPGVPTAVQGTRGDQSVELSWTAPVDNGGSAITSYTVQPLVNGSAAGQTPRSVAGTSTTITGLTNGTTYTFTVAAANQFGTSAASAASAPLKPATVPGAPTIGTAVAGNRTATARWTAPTSSGGEPITKYVVTATPGPISKDVTDTSATEAVFTELTNGVDYTFRVVAVNAVGSSAASAVSNAVTPQPSVPDAPTGLTGAFADGTMSLSWAAPAFDGNSPITGYTVQVTPAAGTTVVDKEHRTATVTGLSPNTSYSFTVKAVNSVGSSAASNTFTQKLPNVPAAPDLTSATAGDQRISVAWTAVPASSNGGSPVTSYTITAVTGDKTQSLTVNAPATSGTITGLDNGKAYTVSVRATNAAGSSPASDSLTATPFGAPGAPTAVKATAGDGQALVTWVAPSADGGRAITGYVVQAFSGSTLVLSSSPLAASARSATIKGLTNGTSYTFKVRATNGKAGELSAASAPVTPKYVTTLTISKGSTPSTVSYNKEFALTGKLIRARTGTGVAGATVTLKFKRYDGVVSTRSVTTGDNGTFSTPVRFSRDVTISGSYAGSGSRLGDATTTIPLAVRSYVKITSGLSSTTSHTTALKITGTVYPSKPGVEVVLYRIEANGSRTRVLATKLTSSSTFSFTGKPGAGTYKLIVVIGKTAGNAAGESSVITAKRT